MLQLEKDFEICKIVPHWGEFFDSAIKDPMVLFRDWESKSTFLKFDTKELRNELIDKLDRCFVKTIVQTDDTACHEYKCDIMIGEGQVCNHIAKSHGSLPLHQISSHLPNHGLRSTAKLVVVTNQCPLCSLVFSDILSTQHHVTNSLNRHRCIADKGYKQMRVLEPATLKCPFSRVLINDEAPMCNFEAQHLSQLQAHICEHLGMEHVVGHEIGLSCTETQTSRASEVGKRVIARIAAGSRTSDKLVF